MTNSTEFDIGEDELGSDNLLRRSIEDAINNERPITFGEYNTFMTSIGALVPAYVLCNPPFNPESGLLFDRFRSFFSLISKSLSNVQSTQSTSSSITQVYPYHSTYTRVFNRCMTISGCKEHFTNYRRSTGAYSLTALGRRFAPRLYRME